MSVKNILFKVDFEGSGLVNYDSGAQKSIHIREKTSVPRYNGMIADNVTFSKKKYSRNEENELEWIARTSKESLRNHIYTPAEIKAYYSFIEGTSPKDVDEIIAFAASFIGLTRGYTSVRANDPTVGKWAKATGFHISSALENRGAKTVFEIGTRSGQRSEGNNLFYKENIGNTGYTAHGVIDMNRLQFMSCDRNLDRLAFNEEYYDALAPILKETLGEGGELGSYVMTTDTEDGIPERGILFTENQVKFLTKDLLGRIFNLQIDKNSGYLAASKMSYKLVENPLADLFDKEDGWKTIESFEDIEDIEFNMFNFYKKVN